MVKFKNLKICHVMTSFSMGGSTENTYTRILNRKDSADFFICAGKSPYRFGKLENKLKSAGVKFTELKFLSNGITPFLDILALFELFLFCSSQIHYNRK